MEDDLKKAALDDHRLPVPGKISLAPTTAAEAGAQRRSVRGAAHAVPTPGRVPSVG